MNALANIPAPPINGFPVGPLYFHFYGLAIALGILAALWLSRRRWQALGRDPAELDRPVFWGVVAGFVGGRIGYVIPRVENFTDRPWAVVAVWEGGLALYGGLVLGITVGVLVARRQGLPVLRTLDAIIPGIPLAQAFGRWGNYFNQELFGTPTTLPWALQVDPGFRPPQYAGFATFHPTFLYESLWNLAVCGALLLLSSRRWLRPGSLLLVYGILYGTGRFLLELIRTDTTFRMFGLSRNAWVSLLVVLVCAVVLYLRERHRARHQDERERDDALHPSDTATGEHSAVPSGNETTRKPDQDDAADPQGEAADGVRSSGRQDGPVPVSQGTKQSGSNPEPQKAGSSSEPDGGGDGGD